MMTVSPEAARRLESEPLMAHLATSVDDRPHVAPVWYRYEDDTIEIVTGGRKLENIRENPRVAVSVQKDEGGDAQWAVVLRGTATVVEDEDENEAATRRIHGKYGADPDAYPDNVLVRIDVGSANYWTY